MLLPLNIPWSQISVTWLGVVHFLACLSPQLGSVVYHLFMNHEGGEPVYHTLLKLDVCGICMINTLGEASALPPPPLLIFLPPSSSSLLLSLPGQALGSRLLHHIQCSNIDLPKPFLFRFFSSKKLIIVINSVGRIGL